MVEKNNFELLKEKYGLCGSWAVWKEPGMTPKSNTEDMTWANDHNLHEKVGTNYVFVGLNWAGGHGDQNKGGTIYWKDFHSDYAYQNDYKLRYALMGTKYWGSYITDIIKYHAETESGKVVSFLKKNPQVVNENIKYFEEELSLLGLNNPTLVAMGSATYDILKSKLGQKYKIVQIKHYSFTIGKEDYRKEVLEVLENT